MEVVVRNKEELQRAFDSKANIIVAKGELAEKLIEARNIRKLSKFKLAAFVAIMGAAAAAAKQTKGLSFVAATPIAASTALSIATVMAVFFVGTGLIIGLFQDYDEFDADLKKCTVSYKRKR